MNGLIMSEGCVMWNRKFKTFNSKENNIHSTLKLIVNIILTSFNVH
jgi:hypothetical protein